MDVYAIDGSDVCIKSKIGNEVYSGRIKDAFGPVLKEKLKEFNIDLERQVILPDDKGKIKRK